MCRAIYLTAILVPFFLLLPIQLAKAVEFPVVVEKELIRVEAPEGYRKYAETIFEHVQVAMRKLNSQTGDALLVPVTFQVAADRETFLALAGGESEHALAVARGSERLVIISMPAMNVSNPEQVQQVLVHELAHIYLEVKTQAQVPRWVHEGVAQMVAGEWPDAPGEARLTIAAYTGGLTPLRDLVHGFPSDISNRNQAYAASYSAIRFLVQESHSDSLPVFLASIRGKEGAPYLKQLGQTVHLNAIEWRWHKELKSPVLALNVLVGSGFLWGVAAILMVIAFFVKKRRSRVLHERWAADEATYVDAEEVPMELEFGQYEVGEEPDDEEHESWR